MNTAIINIKTEISTKKQAQAVASKLGLSLSALINAYLKEVIKTRRVEFSLDETPSPYLIRVLRQAKKNREAGKGSPIFDTGEEAVKWLEEQGI
ncbi:MAG: type II toxin-antitoxin system RelB/DinJ family antitoxin [Candidatus Levybacteria bacterium]|nr:type II toxin-antitoxin system RelB/DinJ family antitoxin [Candidatus Levybacteria bacterium]